MLTKKEIAGMTNQEIADAGKERAVDNFHLSNELHARACDSKDAECVKITGSIMRQTSTLKDDGLALNGRMGIKLQSGGT